MPTSSRLRPPRRFGLLLAVAGALALFPAAGASASTIDTYSTWNGVSGIIYWGPAATPTYGQSITVPAGDTSLQSFSFWLKHNGSTSTTYPYRAYVYAWNGTTATGAALWQSPSAQSVTLTGAFQEVKIDVGGIPVTPGSQYVLFLSSAGMSAAGAGAGNWGAHLSNVYSGGEFRYHYGTTYANSYWSYHGPYDLAMKVEFGSTDADGDGVADADDNCPSVSNADQANTDGDAEGDACDADDDNDTVSDSEDNCELVSNTDQANNDGDAQGDLCDADDDNDSVNDSADNCDRIANTDQANNDSDGQGDLCDADDDNDTVVDGSDNCSMVANTDQRDDDADGKGDVCDDAFDSSAGKSNGGGWFTQEGAKVNFSASAKSQDGTALDGTCVVTSAGTKVKCLDVDGYYQSSTSDRVVFVGDATVNGNPTRYRIELEDLGEPGTADRIAISTDSGFAAGGTIGGGNIQVHRG